MAETEKAYSFDGDGVLFFRPPIQAALFRVHVDLPLASEGVPGIQTGVAETPLGPREYPSYLIHLFKFVYPAARRVLPLLNGDSYLNTGRRNTKPWVDLTLRSMKRAGIGDYFRGFYFCPRGLSTGLSKLAVIAELRNRYPQVTHFDDNPLDGLLIARHFPDVRMALVQDWSTRLFLRRLKIDLEQFDNVVIARNLSEAVYLLSKGLSSQG